jgi:hypothetical protein
MPSRTCTGCGRTLAVNADNFYRQDTGDGFTAKCRDCLRAYTREYKARKRATASPRPKRCSGPCGRTLPREAFKPDTLGRPRPRCRDCERAAETVREMERKAARERRDAAVRDRHDQRRHAPGKTCTRCESHLPATLEHFYAYDRSPDGLEPLCKGCIEDVSERREAAKPPPPRSPEERAKAAARVERYNAQLLPHIEHLRVPTSREREAAERLAAGKFDPLAGCEAVTALIDALRDEPERRGASEQVA